MKNKGFTLVELLGVIVLVVIVSGLAVYSVSVIIQNGKKGIYKNHEATLKSAAENYYIDNIDNIPNIGKQGVLSMADLASYLDKIIDPNGGSCEFSKVYVFRDNDVSNNIKLSYKVCLICKNGDNETYASDMDSEDKFCH